MKESGTSLHSINRVSVSAIEIDVGKRGSAIDDLNAAFMETLEDKFPITGYTFQIAGKFK